MLENGSFRQSPETRSKEFIPTRLLNWGLGRPKGCSCIIWGTVSPERCRVSPKFLLQVGERSDLLSRHLTKWRGVHKVSGCESLGRRSIPQVSTEVPLKSGTSKMSSRPPMALDIDDCGVSHTPKSALRHHLNLMDLSKWPSGCGLLGYGNQNESLSRIGLPFASGPQNDKHLPHLSGPVVLGSSLNNLHIHFASE